jgi:hypothetical protein
MIVINENIDDANNLFHQLVDMFNRTNKNNDRLHLWRGQRIDTWKLLPKSARQFKFNFFNSGKENYIYNNYLEYESKIISEFKRLSSPYIDKNLSDIELLTIAQHHGLPTRLLDWTANPLVALYFAFREEKSESEYRILWLLKQEYSDIMPQEKINPFGLKDSTVFKPTHSNKRIIAQNGYFTCHKFNEGAGFFSLENQIKFKKSIGKIPIKSSLREEILYTLDKFGINEASLFPDLDGLSKYLDWKIKPKLV